MSDVPSAPRYPIAEEDASWTAITAGLDELVAAFRNGDVQGVEAAFGRTLAIPFDIEAFINVIRVPRDACDDADALGDPSTHSRRVGAVDRRGPWLVPSRHCARPAAG